MEGGCELCQMKYKRLSQELFTAIVWYIVEGMKQDEYRLNDILEECHNAGFVEGPRAEE